MSLKKKGIAVFAAAALSVSVAGGVAYAYYSGHGTGAGTAATDTAATPLVITQDAAAKSVFPGGSVDLTGKITNNNRVQVRISGIDGIITVEPLSGQVCSADNYSFEDGWMESNVEAAPLHSSTWTGTLSMKASETNQDGCKGATVHIAYTAVPRKS